MKTPVISVIMSVYNTEEEYLRESIESILNQTFQNFEFIIINDCSNENTSHVLASYHDPRIRIYRNPENYGLTKSLNAALHHCQGEFIARMDSDDVAMPDRFQVQYDWMKEHSKCGACGSLVRIIGAKRRYSIRWNKQYEVKRARMLFYDAGIVHPTAFIRKSVLDKNHIQYREEIKKAQDYALWADMIQVSDIQLIPKVLLKYRISDSQISSTSHEQQVQCEFMTIRRQLSRYSLSEKEMDILCHFYRGEIKNAHNLNKALQKLIAANQEDRYYSDSALTQQISVLYTQAAIKQIRRFHSSSMLRSSFFFRLLIPSHFAAFLHYLIFEKKTA